MLLHLLRSNELKGWDQSDCFQSNSAKTSANLDYRSYNFKYWRFDLDAWRSILLQVILRRWGHALNLLSFSLMPQQTLKIPSPQFLWPWT